MSVKLICAYCGHAKPKGPCGCKKSQDSLKKIDQIINGTHRQITQPNYKPQTSDQMKQRADRLRQMATGVKLNGGQVKPEYQ